MTIWNQIRTIAHWHNDTTPEGAGTAVYNAAGESWDLEAGKSHYFTERGGWVDGYRPKSMRISFTGGSTIQLYVIRKPSGQVVSNKRILSGQKVSLATLTSDLSYMILYTISDETPTITNIAFSDEEYTEPSLEQETWSDINWSGYDWQLHRFADGESDEAVYSMLMEVSDGTPHFIVNTGFDYDYGFPSVYYKYGIKYENGQWTYISKNESDSTFSSSEYDKFIRTDIGYAFEGMVLLNNGVVNAYYDRDGALISGVDIYQNYNIEGPPVNLDQSSVGHDYGWAEWSHHIFEDVSIPYSCITHTAMGKIIVGEVVVYDDGTSQIWYANHYWNDPFTVNWNDNSCMILEDTDPDNAFRWINMISGTDDVIHLLYVHKEGSTYSIKHIKNEVGTWSSPVTLVSKVNINLVIYPGQLAIDSENNLLFMHMAYRDLYTYNGSSWSSERLGITTSLGSPYNDIVLDNRDNLHMLAYSYADSALKRITNENGRWEEKVIASDYSDVTFSSVKFKYDSDNDRFYIGMKGVAEGDVGFIYYGLPTPQIDSTSSASSESQSSSSSADSKSSLSSESSSESSSSRSSESESSSSFSSSADSKSSSSSSESESSLSSSSSADSKSSSSESSSSHSSPSEFSCSTFGGNFATGQTYSATKEDYGGTANYAFETGGVWWVGSPDYGNDWVQIDLDYPKAASLVELYSSNSALTATGFDLYASTTGNFTGEEHLILSESGISFPSPDYMVSFETYLDQQFSSYRFVITDGPQLNMRVVLIKMYECYDVISSSSSESSVSQSSSSDSSSSSIDSKSSSSISSSSYSPISKSSSSLSSSSESSNSFDLVGLYELCENFNVSSSSSSRSESSISGPPDFIDPIEE